MSSEGGNVMVVTSKVLTILLNAEHRLILYYLANNNPRIDEQTLAKETGLDSNMIREILSHLQSTQLAQFESEHGYTLTEKGLASLYNYHQTIK